MTVETFMVVDMLVKVVLVSVLFGLYLFVFWMLPSSWIYNCSWRQRVKNSVIMHLVVLVIFAVIFSFGWAINRGNIWDDVKESALVEKR